MRLRREKGKGLKIGGHWFKVRYTGEREGLTGSGVKLGWKNEIILQKDCVPSKRISTLLHEIIHEIDFQSSLGLTEIQVNVLSESLYQVLTDNDIWQFAK